ncbi:MAG: bacillithiol biosynthesis deacetylase BshB1 [Bacteroidota bacterium]|jgi:bacillithiol biosynthesis deacetylase BshB1
MKLDILVFAVHPDDAELACAGTIMLHLAKGKKVGIVDLTKGELGTRGSVEIRMVEAAIASDIMGLTVREHLNLEDGFFRNDRDNQLPLIQMIRKYQPEIVITNALEDRHPDHGRACALQIDACFLAGLMKIETSLDGNPQEAWRPKHVYNYIQDRYIKPDFVIDITPFWEKKMEAIKVFSSQFYDPNSTEPMTYIANDYFLSFVEGRALEMGHAIGVKYGEGFTKQKMLAVDDLFDLK